MVLAATGRTRRMMTNLDRYSTLCVHFSDESALQCCAGDGIDISVAVLEMLLSTNVYQSHLYHIVML